MDLQEDVSDEEMDAFLTWLFGPGTGDDEKADSEADGGQVDTHLSGR